MSDYVIEEEKYRGYTIKLKSDDDAANPIEDWDMLGSFACWHRRSNLCSKDVSTGTPYRDGKSKKYHFETPQDFEDFCKRKEVIRLPLALYEHSGMTMWVGKGPSPFDPGGWDSGQVGFIFVERDKILEEYSCKKITKKVRERVDKTLRSEVEVFDDYLTGNVCGFVVEDSQGKEADSCWGFFGDSGKKHALEEAKHAVDAEISSRVKERCQQIKDWIRNKVPFIYRTFETPIA